MGKAEWCNPGGSVKDRAAANIVSEARRSGQLGPGKMLLDATSGNTGIAYAMLGAAEGFPVTLCMPGNVSRERKRILHGYGAKVHYTDPAGDPMGRSAWHGKWRRIILIDTVISTNTRMRLIGRRITTARPRNLAADAGARDALRVGTGHERNVHGHDAKAERI